MTLMRLTEETYKQAKELLHECFDPPSNREVYKAELQCHTKRSNESWGDFGDKPLKLANQAYPEFQDAT